MVGTDPTGLLHPDQSKRAPGNTGPGAPPCKPSPNQKRCLDKVLGEDVENVAIKAESWFAKLHGYATTRRNTIYVNDTCSGFFGNHFTVLEEYYHVLKQWNTGRLGSAAEYVYDNWRDGGYDKNRWEVEAKTFAGNKLEEYKQCLNCSK
jgi:hypothetical protein